MKPTATRPATATARPRCGHERRAGRSEDNGHDQDADQDLHHPEERVCGVGHVGEPVHALADEQPAHDAGSRCRRAPLSALDCVSGQPEHRADQQGGYPQKGINAVEAVRPGIRAANTYPRSSAPSADAPARAGVTNREARNASKKATNEHSQPSWPVTRPGAATPLRRERQRSKESSKLRAWDAATAARGHCATARWGDPPRPPPTRRGTLAAAPPPRLSRQPYTQSRNPEEGSPVRR
jgi:hypothetical protein